MSEYNQKYNKDDVFIRSMIVCLLAELNKKMYIYNRLDDGKPQKINIPCLYSITGGERFLKDEFYYDALEEGKAFPICNCIRFLYLIEEQSEHTCRSDDSDWSEEE